MLEYFTKVHFFIYLMGCTVPGIFLSLSLFMHFYVYCIIPHESYPYSDDVSYHTAVAAANVSVLCPHS